MLLISDALGFETPFRLASQDGQPHEALQRVFTATERRRYNARLSAANRAGVSAKAALITGKTALTAD